MAKLTEVAPTNRPTDVTAETAVLEMLSHNRASIDSRVRHVIHILERTRYQPISLIELAKQAGLSPSRLTHLFRQEMGICMRSFLRRRRLLLAAALIMETSERISVIAYSVGYSDASNFNHSFKSEFGISPTLLRSNPVSSRSGGDRRG